MFGTLDAPTQNRFAGSGPDVEALSHDVMDAWIAFTRGGDPSHERIGTWPPYEPERRLTLVFDRESRLEEGPFEEERAAWDGILR